MLFSPVEQENVDGHRSVTGQWEEQHKKCNKAYTQILFVVNRAKKSMVFKAR